jgi:hypothetical protein
VGERGGNGCTDKNLYIIYGSQEPRGDEGSAGGCWLRGVPGVSQNYMQCKL